MIRDPELVKKILLEYEKLEYPDKTVSTIIEGHTAAEIIYHQHLLNDAGWVVGNFLPSGDGGIITAKRLTNDGHDFLEKMKNDTVWARTKQQIAEKGGGMALDIISSLLTAYMRAQMGLP